MAKNPYSLAEFQKSEANYGKITESKVKSE
jgi:hypothetical protein